LIREPRSGRGLFLLRRLFLSTLCGACTRPVADRFADSAMMTTNSERWIARSAREISVALPACLISERACRGFAGVSRDFRTRTRFANVARRSVRKGPVLLLKQQALGYH
jgi:hypothetical protein